MTPEQLRILALMYAWRFEGRMRCDADGNQLSVERLDEVPEFVLMAELHGTGVVIASQLEILERKGLVQGLSPGLPADGCWRLDDGRLLRATVEYKREPPDSPFVLVGAAQVRMTIDGVEIDADASHDFFDLTGAGTGLAEHALGALGEGLDPASHQSAVDAPTTSSVDPKETRDTPSETGYVFRPTDPAAYVALQGVLTHHTPSGWPLNAKAIVRIVEDFRAHRVRWTRPLDKKGHPITNRRSIHLGDWHAHCEGATQRDPEGFPVIAEAQIEVNKAAIRDSKGTGE